MQYCKHCNMYHNDTEKTCIACGHVLVKKTPENQVIAPGYPPVKVNKQKYSIAAKIIILIGIVASIVVSLVNLLTYESFPKLWSLIVVGSLVYIYFMIRQIIKDKHDYSMKTLVHTLVASLILIVLDFAFGYSGWAISYTIPFILVGTTILLPIIVAAKPSKYYLHVRNLVWLILIDVLFFILTISTSLIKTDMTWTGYMTLLSGITLFIAMFLFAPKTTYQELFKFFRI